MKKFNRIVSWTLLGDPSGQSWKREFELKITYLYYYFCELKCRQIEVKITVFVWKLDHWFLWSGFFCYCCFLSGSKVYEKQLHSMKKKRICESFSFSWRFFLGRLLWWEKELSTDNWDMMLFDIFTTSVDIYKKNCS